MEGFLFCAIEVMKQAHQIFKVCEFLRILIFASNLAFFLTFFSLSYVS